MVYILGPEFLKIAIYAYDLQTYTNVHDLQTYTYTKTYDYTNFGSEDVSKEILTDYSGKMLPSLIICFTILSMQQWKCLRSHLIIV